MIEVNEWLTFLSRDSRDLGPRDLKALTLSSFPLTPNGLSLYSFIAVLDSSMGSSALENYWEQSGSSKNNDGENITTLTLIRLTSKLQVIFRAAIADGDKSLKSWLAHDYSQQFAAPMEHRTPEKKAEFEKRVYLQYQSLLNWARENEHLFVDGNLSLYIIRERREPVLRKPSPRGESGDEGTVDKK